MNWKLIAGLSGFGVLMGIASVMGLTKGIEGRLWLITGVICAVWIARVAPAKLFRHGFFVGLIGGAIGPLIQVIFFSTYLSNNPEAAEQFKRTPVNIEARSLMLIMAPILGLFSGLFLGLLTWVAGKVIRRGTAQASMP